MRRGFLLAAAAAMMLGAAAPKPAAVYDHLIGCWSLAGQVRGKPVRQLARGRWTFSHRYFELDLISAPGEKPYASSYVFGHEDNGRLVVVLLDTFGAEYTKTLGRGTDGATGTDAMFDYPDGPTRNQVNLLPGGKWRMLVTETPTGKPMDVFSDATATKSRCPTGNPFPL